jgi:mRNA interferase HigB
MPMRMFWKRKYHGRMHVITRKRLNEFPEKFPETKSALAHWYMAIRKVTFLTLPSFARSSQPPTELVLTVFNIGGNRVRLIAAIHYNRKKVCIRAVLAHTEYDEGEWKE